MKRFPQLQHYFRAPRFRLETWAGLLLLVSLPFLVVGLLWLADSYAELHRPAELPHIVYYEVPPGSGLLQVALDWQKLGLVRHPRSLVLLAGLAGRREGIRAGEYELHPGETPWRMLETLRRGDVLQHRVTIRPGWTLAELLKHLRHLPRLRRTLPADPGAAAAQMRAALQLPEASPEGLFLPETYYYAAHHSDLQVLRHAHEALREALGAAWRGRDPELPLRTPYEALVLASIVEREAVLAREQPIIAGVFLRRLQRGMRLQADPTVSYGRYGHYRQRLRRSDLHHDSPYNTYHRSGLPPTPIALPSRSAIEAVLHPVPGRALYFVAGGDGSHVFSDTLAEHNRAVARYRARRQAQSRARSDRERATP